MFEQVTHYDKPLPPLPRYRRLPTSVASSPTASHSSRHTESSERLPAERQQGETSSVEAERVEELSGEEPSGGVGDEEDRLEQESRQLLEEKERDEIKAIQKVS